MGADDADGGSDGGGVEGVGWLLCRGGAVVLVRVVVLVFANKVERVVAFGLEKLHGYMFGKTVR